LHNPANLKGIRAVREVLGPGVAQVAVFDTAFHATMPEAAFLYGVPYRLYRRYGLRRYGFHGTSHRYVAYRYRRILRIRREAVNLVTLHLGNGCSACSIRGGESVDTSMGLTPLEGLLMGTRCGDLDPAIPLHLQQREGRSLTEIDAMLNEESGLLGLSGTSSDMRDLLRRAEEEGDRRATLAIDVFCHRARKYAGAYAVGAGGADAVVFTGGIGENAAGIRRRICEGLEPIGLELDERRNAELRGGASGRISSGGSRLAAWVIPTDEELLIARDTFRIVGSGAG
jgi:acetate kinase